MKRYTNRCETCGRGCNVDESGQALCGACRNSTTAVREDQSKGRHDRDRQVHGIILRHDKSGSDPESQAIESEVISTENVMSSTCEACETEL